MCEVCGSPFSGMSPMNAVSPHLSLSGGGVFVWSSCVFVYIGVNSQQERKMKEEISEHDG